MKKNITLIALLIGLCLCAAFFVLKRTSPQMKFSPIAEAKAEHLRKVIRTEIEQLGSHAWAGEYYFGDGLGVNVTLLIAPESGYLFEWHGCLGLYDRNYGRVKEKNGAIRLSFTYPNKQEGFQGIADEFIPVAWGERKYLVSPDNMIGFCNDVNSKNEPRQEIHGLQFLKAGDQLKPVTGDPDVPAAYKKYLLKNPIIAEVTSVAKISTRPFVKDGESQDIIVTLNNGLNSGLLSGMKLYMVSPHNSYESIELQEVNPHESKGLMRRFAEGQEILQGAILSTVPYWRMPEDVTIQSPKEQ